MGWKIDISLTFRHRLMAGTWMAQTQISAIIIDEKPCRTQYGHADGIESRTFEILDSFGVGDNVWKNANRTIDLSIWVSVKHSLSFLILVTVAAVLHLEDKKNILPQMIDHLLTI
jgi:hypothetical protein